MKRTNVKAFLSSLTFKDAVGVGLGTIIGVVFL
jgi:hypothetical protein